MNILRASGTLEVNAVDVIGVETLRLFEPDFYNSIRDSKSTLTATRSLDSSDKKRVAEDILAIVATAHQDRNKAATALIRTLFPTTGFAFGGPTYSAGHHPQWEQDLRICSPEYFDRYFQLDLSKGDVSQAQVERLIALCADYGELKNELLTLNSTGQLVAAIDRLDNSRDKIAPANVVPTLTALFDISELLPAPEPAGALQDHDWTIIRLANALLNAEPASTRLLKLEAVLKGTVGLRLPMRFIGVISSSKERGTNPGEVSIPDDEMISLREVCIEKIKNSATNGQLLPRHDLAFLLFRWLDWGSETEPREWVRSVTIGSPDGSLALLRGFLHKGTSQTVGDRVARVTYFMKYSELERIADIEQLSQEVEKLSEAKLSEDDRKVLQEFRKALGRKRAGKVEGDFGWQED